MEYTIKAFTMERLKIRKENPVRSNVLLMLADAVKSITIDERRPETEADFKRAALKMHQETQNTIAEYKKGGAATDELEEELRVIEGCMPKGLAADGRTGAAEKVIDSLPEADRT